MERPFNLSSSTSNVRGYNSSPCMPPVPSPFASMFTGDLTRFLSGTAFAEVRLAALSSTCADSSAAQGAPSSTSTSSTSSSSLLCHASRLTRVSEVLRERLGPMLKTLPARPHGYGCTEAQPLVALDAPLPVLRAFHRMLYEASVSIPAALLPGLLRMAVLYDMPELELWALQQAHAAGDKLSTPPGEAQAVLPWCLYCCGRRV
jgi:hypothetical protein